MRPVSYYIAERDKALARGDIGRARALTADLERVGWSARLVPPAKVEEEEPEPGPEFTRIKPRRERAVPAQRERAVEE